jgi:Uma2 family endonuclease
MAGRPQRRYSLDDYFAVEASSAIRHEYVNGEIFAMAGASIAHNRIVANVLTHLRMALRGGPCSAFGRDLRLATPGGLYTYPDVVVICGPPTLIPGRPDTVTNPALLVEVLSEATRDYDCGEKLVAYQSIPTLREVLLVEQDTVRVERVHRTASGTWAREEATRLDAVWPRRWESPCRSPRCSDKCSAGHCPDKRLS